MTTEIDLGPHFDGFVRDQVDSGRFRDATEVVRAGLKLLEQREADRGTHRDALLREIGEAFDAVGPTLPLDAVFDRLEERHAERVRRNDRGA
ncbi:type II toxin-antitoxin system ParD family antitoxin [Methylobacterium sp. NEAU 140]|uniref:type II toxin-antitoxin system ParD family antitoxin n=1 Tax=Methylobacterium sp. NEAU 140 TaxID=3064945 RepID=UPI0027367270|nr:type II toxin-antitoxin system ParD family antitoxin [Methylobacterium sp. NEAU 140]MDP4024392.1 type II toxin-antitoxin system ParD family antitoxin [Methylobacterium sp. NEAU 140]